MKKNVIKIFDNETASFKVVDGACKGQNISKN